MLNIEECKNLEKWGMPQDLKEGDWYYWLAGKNPHFQPIIVGDDSHWTNNTKAGIDWVLIPDLETIIEFAVKMAKEGFRQLNILYKDEALTFKELCFVYRGDIWEVWVEANEHNMGAYGPQIRSDIDQALYDLIEFRFEVEEQLKKRLKVKDAL